MHPTAALIVWLLVTLAVQSLDYPALLAIAVVFLWAGGGPVAAWRYVKRARWLLLSLWLIIAYHTPGEALGDSAWAPTYEGAVEASRHAVRLVVMLIVLAWLFVRQGRDGLVAGLWGALSPLRVLGVETGRLVVRLSLVLEQVQAPAAKGAWRRMLHGQPLADPAGAGSLRIESSPWQPRDQGLVALALIILVLALWS